MSSGEVLAKWGGQANQIKQQTYLPGGNCNGTRNRRQTEFEENWRQRTKQPPGHRCVYPADTFDALLTQSHSICFGSLECCNCCCLRF